MATTTFNGIEITFPDELSPVFSAKIQGSHVIAPSLVAIKKKISAATVNKAKPISALDPANYRRDKYGVVSVIKVEKSRGKYRAPYVFTLADGSHENSLYIDTPANRKIMGDMDKMEARHSKESNALNKRHEKEREAIGKPEQLDGSLLLGNYGK